MERINQIAKGMVVVMIVAFCSCTKYNYIDGGIANGVHDCTMWEYFHTDSYNWDSTIIMIEHAGLKSLFDGTGEYEQITFFGLTNLSILRYMMDWKRQILIICIGLRIFPRGNVRISYKN